jgi:hypothetical protein
MLQQMSYVSRMLPFRNLKNPRCTTTVWLALSVVGCGAAPVKSGVGVGTVGAGLAHYTESAAHSAELCLLKDSLATPTGGVDRSLAESCVKAQKTDLLWRRAVQAISLYGVRLSAAASGEDAETSGKLEGAMTGLNGTDWSDADDQAAREAVTQLVSQMTTPTNEKLDLAKLIQDAAPPIRTLCSSLNSMLEAQLSELTNIRKDIDKKSVSRAIRRCGTYENHPICVADTVVDHLVYAETFARVATMENGTYEAKDGFARFCAAHDKLAEAAQNGQLNKKETFGTVVEAVKAVPRSQAAWDAETSRGGDQPKPAKK